MAVQKPSFVPDQLTPAAEVRKFNFTDLIDITLPEPPFPSPDTEFDPSIVADPDVRQRLHRAYLRLTPSARLTERQTDFFVLIIHCALGIRETADFFGVIEQAVENAIVRAGRSLGLTQAAFRREFTRYYWIEYGRDSVLSPHLTPGFGGNG